MFDPNAHDEFGFNDITIRRNFLCKVFSIYICQLLMALAFVTVAIFHDPTRLYVQSHPSLSIIASFITLSILIALACSENLRRKSPNNFIFLFMVTVALSFLLATSVSHYYPNQVLLALCLATLICFALTMFALQTKIDFTVMGGFLMIFVIVLLVASIITLFFPGTIMSLIVAFAGVIIYCLYLIYDIQMVVGGDHEYSISPDEYILAALTIYIDIVNMLMNMLAMMVTDH
ncbi:protein lifeguard 2-like [Myzus persicae]|uniref:protein lifeguard 2-like n=1 Tax=Myzus persicae TaxID=13164 RepID=UPI000B9395DF|nr:protein lifeguard 2-like [Myzus persicae]